MHLSEILPSTASKKFLLNSSQLLPLFLPSSEPPSSPSLQCENGHHTPPHHCLVFAFLFLLVCSLNVSLRKSLQSGTCTLQFLVFWLVLTSLSPRCPTIIHSFFSLASTSSTPHPFTSNVHHHTITTSRQRRHHGLLFHIPFPILLLWPRPFDTSTLLQVAYIFNQASSCGEHPILSALTNSSLPQQKHHPHTCTRLREIVISPPPLAHSHRSHHR